MAEARVRCRACQEEKERADFSKAQLKKNDLRRCKECLESLTEAEMKETAIPGRLEQGEDTQGDPSAESELASAPPLEDANVLRQAQVVSWMMEQVEKEKSRLKELGVAVKELRVSKSMLVRDGKKLWNRLEIDSALDFSHVEQILISPSLACTLKPGYACVNVILFFVNRPDSPYLLPYLYKRNMKRNVLSHWAFINSRGQQAKHTVEYYDAIEEQGDDEEDAKK